MKPAERPDFEKHLAVLCAGLDVPCTEDRKDAYWIALKDMHLATFIRVVEFMLREEEWVKMPKPAQIWAASKRMRASGPPEKPVDDGWRGDDWDIVANNHLRAHLTRTLHQNPKCYGRPASVKAMQALDYKKHPNADASPEFIANVKLLVSAKNSWAAAMRQYGNEAPVDIQQQCWKQHIDAAEAEIAERML